MKQKEMNRIGFMLAGGDEIISQYEKHIDGYKLVVEALNNRIKELEKENDELRQKVNIYANRKS